MKISSPDIAPPLRVDRTANQRFRARAGTRMLWSIAASAAVHATVFLVVPALRAPAPAPGVSSGEDHLRLVALAADLPGEGPGAPASFVVVEQEALLPDEIPVDPLDGEATVASDPWGSWNEGGEALQRLASVLPTVVDLPPNDSVPSPEQGRPSEGSPDADGTFRVRGPGLDLETERLTAEELLDLERLSALNPELAFSVASRWLTIRNPDEVGGFLHERFEGRSGPGEDGLKSMAVSLWIDERGSVEWAEVSQSSGNPELDESALQLFRNVVTFRPASEQGLRVPVAAIFWVPFW